MGIRNRSAARGTGQEDSAPLTEMGDQLGHGRYNQI